DIDDSDRAVIGLGAEGGLLGDSEPLLRTIVVRVPRAFDFAVKVAKCLFLAGLNGYHQTCVIHCLSFFPRQRPYYSVCMTVSPLTRDLLDWIASTPRTYRETMEAWRTSCPRLSIWEDAVGDG